MLSECCLQRQHSDKISVFDLFQRPKTLISSQRKAKNTSFARMLSQCCLNVVSRDNIQTTIREHSNNIGTKHFLKNLGHVCNSQPMLLDGPVQINFLALTNCVVDLYVPPKPTCILMQTPNIGRNITQQVVSKKEHLVTCANRRRCADIVWGLADCGLTLDYWGTAEWDNNNIWSGSAKQKQTVQNEVEIMQLRRDTIGTLAVKLCSHIGPIGRDNIESTKTSRWESAMLQVCHKVINPEYQQKQHPC